MRVRDRVSAGENTCWKPVPHSLSLVVYRRDVLVLTGWVGVVGSWVGFFDTTDVWFGV